MDREKFWGIVRKEFTIPRDLLKNFLFLSITANLALVVWVLVLIGDSYEAEFEAERIAYSAGSEMAKTDIRNGRPRYIRLNVVDLGARATYGFEETGETHGGLPVWEWRWVEKDPDNPRPLTYPQHLISAYNGTIDNFLHRDRTVK